MENGRTFHRRSLVRIVSFTLAALVALSAAAVSGYAAASNSRTSIEYSYQRALGELTDYVNNITLALEKGKYASTEKQLQGLSGKLLRETGYAKVALNQLPVEGTELSATYKFLSQLGAASAPPLQPCDGGRHHHGGGARPDGSTHRLRRPDIRPSVLYGKRAGQRRAVLRGTDAVGAGLIGGGSGLLRSGQRFPGDGGGV